MSAYSNAISVATSSIGTILARLLIFAVLARLILPADFGVAAMAFSIIAILAPIVDLDLRDALIQRKEISRRHAIAAVICCTISSILISAVIVWIAGRAEYYSGVDGVGILLRAMCLILFLDSFANIAQGLLLRARREKTVGRMEVSSFAFGFGPIALIAAFMGLDVWALTLGYIGLSAFRCFYSWYVVWRIDGTEIFRIAEVQKWSEVLRDLLRYSRGGVATRLLMRTSLNLDNVLVGKFLNAQALGLYSRAFNLTSLPVNQSIGLTIRTVVFPEFSRRHHGEEESARSAALRAVQLGAMLLMPFCAAISVLSGELVAILLGPNWTEAAPVLSILAIGLSLRFAPRLAIALCRAKGQLVPSVQMNFVTVVLIAIFVPAGAMIGNIEGAAVGMTITSIIQWYWSMRIMAKGTSTGLAVLLAVQIRPFLLGVAVAALLFGGRMMAISIGATAIPSLLLAGVFAGAIALPFVLYAPQLIWPDWLRAKIAHNLMNQRDGLPPLFVRWSKWLGARYER